MCAVCLHFCQISNFMLGKSHGFFSKQMQPSYDSADPPGLGADVTSFLPSLAINKRAFNDPNISAPHSSHARKASWVSIACLCCFISCCLRAAHGVGAVQSPFSCKHPPEERLFPHSGRTAKHLQKANSNGNQHLNPELTLVFLLQHKRESDTNQTPASLHFGLFLDIFGKSWLALLVCE